MSQERVDALPPGFQLFEYRIESILGQGSFGITYLARDTLLDHRVAIKEFLPAELAVRKGHTEVTPRSAADVDDFRRALDGFLHEGQILARFHHPNIVPIHRFFEAHGTAYTVMAYQEGESLWTRLRRQDRLDEEALRAILFPLLDGLAEVHAAGVLHRDIKPGNIYLRDDGTPVLLDFGSARFSLERKSRSVTAVVTAGYAPIEQYTTSGDQGPWTDIYALAAVCYRAISGARPPEAPDRVRDDPMAAAAEIAADRYEPALLSAIDAALALHGEDRPADVAGWREMLEGRRRAVTATAIGARPQGGEPRRGSLVPAVVAVGLSALLVIAGGAYLLLDQDRRQLRVRADEGVRALEAAQATLESEREALETARRQAEEARRQAESEAELRETEAAARRAAEQEVTRIAAESAKQQAESDERLEALEAARQQAVAASRSAAKMPVKPAPPTTTRPARDPASGGGSVTDANGPPWIGVAYGPVTADLARQKGLGNPRGAFIEAVSEGGPADRAGIGGGDVILMFAGRPVPRTSDLKRLVAGSRIGDWVEILVWRDRRPSLVEIRIGTRPQPAS